MAEIHRNPQKHRRSRSLSGRFGFMFTKPRLEEAMAAEDEQNIAAFELYHDEGSIHNNNNNNNNSGATGPSSRLAISSRDFYSEPSGSETPPLNSFCSVPFKWEETPGKVKQGLLDEQSNSSSEAQDRSCRWDYDYDEEFDLKKVVDGSVGFEVQEKLVAVHAATPTNNDAGNDHMTPQSRKCRRKFILTKLLGDIVGSLRSAIDSARRIW